jgi:hypothetical protein
MRMAGEGASETINVEQHTQWGINEEDDATRRILLIIVLLQIFNQPAFLNS